MIYANVGFAQGNYDWTKMSGATLGTASIDAATWKNFVNEYIDNGKDPEDLTKTVWLYNVGQKKFLSAGGEWGLTALLNDIGTRLWLEKYDGASNEYYIHSTYSNWGRCFQITDDKDLPFDRGVNTALYAGAGKTDKYYNGDKDDLFAKNNAWKFIKVDDGKYNTFNIKTTVPNGDFADRYLTYVEPFNDKGNCINAVKDNPEQTVANSDNAKWRIMTFKDILDMFSRSVSSDDKPIEATFLIHGEGFSRNDNYCALETGGWKWTNSTGSFAYPVVGDAAGSNNVKGPNENFVCRLTDPGILSQSFTASKPGYYIISVMGVNPNDKLVAYVGEVTGDFNTELLTTTALNGADKYGNPAATFDGYSAAFSKSNEYVSVKVEVKQAGETVNFGVWKSSDSSQPTYIDNFRVEYYGTGVIFLDEDQPTLNYMGDCVEMQKQSNREEFDLILNKTFHSDKWSTICLPVNIKKSSFVEGFGESAQIGVLTKAENKTIYFETIKLSEKGDDDIVIAKGQPYIMKVINAEAEKTATANEVDLVKTYYTHFGDPTQALNADDKFYMIPSVNIERFTEPLKFAANPFARTNLIVTRA